MTTTDTTLVLDDSTLGDDDPRAVFAGAVVTGASVIAAVRPDQLVNPTPCDDFDVRRLLGHLVDVLGRVAAMGRGEDPFSVPPVEGVADNGWPQAWAGAAHAVQAAWSDDTVLERTITLPWSTASGGDTLLGYVNEVTVHTWDLAVATGQEPAWDPRALDAAAAGIGGMPATERSQLFAAIKAGMPEEYRSGPDPFADAVPTADDAPAIDRVVAWSGRRPGWRP